MGERPVESWRVRAAVSEAIDVFNSAYMQETWTKALARRETDPEGAVTSARTLLESLCKHILEDAGKTPRVGTSLPDLYKAVAAELEISPDVKTAPIFATLFTACAEVIKGIGSLRNSLSDAHGRGPFGTMPDWRHAELAVNLSGAMATYLAAVWKGRQPTVADVIRNVLSDPDKRLGVTHRYALERLSRDPIGERLASRLQVSDLVAHAEHRTAMGVMPQTLNQDMVYLRGALGDSVQDVFDDAMIALRARQLVGKSIARKRRSTHDEYDTLIAFLREQDESSSRVIFMADLVEFAVWSGRPRGEICSLKWSDVDFDKRTCKLPGSAEPFPVLEKAWDAILSRKTAGATDERIFPYVPESVSQRFLAVKKELSKTMPSVKNLRLSDLRFEAVNRLLEKGHPPHTVARATGTAINKVNEIYEEIERGAVEGDRHGGQEASRNA